MHTMHNMCRCQLLLIDFPHDCRLMKQVADEAGLLAEELGYENGEAFIVDYLKLDLDVVQQVISFLDQEQPKEAVAVKQVIELKSHGGDRRSEQAQQDQGSETTLKQERGADYIKARLKRDHPEIAEELERGEHRSARAAAIEAGIVKPVPSVQLKEPSATAQKVIAKKGKEWSIQFAQALLEQTA